MRKYGVRDQSTHDAHPVSRRECFLECRSPLWLHLSFGHVTPVVIVPPVSPVLSWLFLRRGDSFVPSKIFSTVTRPRRSVPSHNVRSPYRTGSGPQCFVSPKVLFSGHEGTLDDPWIPYPLLFGEGVSFHCTNLNTKFYFWTDGNSPTLPPSSLERQNVIRCVLSTPGPTIGSLDPRTLYEAFFFSCSERESTLCHPLSLPSEMYLFQKNFFHLFN